MHVSALTLDGSSSLLRQILIETAYIRVPLPLISDGLKHVEEIKFNKCIYIEDVCLERLSSIESLQDSLLSLEVVSCGNVTDKGVIALHRLRSVCFSSPMAASVIQTVGDAHCL